LCIAELEFGDEKGKLVMAIAVFALVVANPAGSNPPDAIPPEMASCFQPRRRFSGGGFQQGFR
jgi:hypothetical protein